MAPASDCLRKFSEDPGCILHVVIPSWYDCPKSLLNVTPLLKISSQTQATLLALMVFPLLCRLVLAIPIVKKLRTVLRYVVCVPTFWATRAAVLVLLEWLKPHTEERQVVISRKSGIREIMWLYRLLLSLQVISRLFKKLIWNTEINM